MEPNRKIMKEELNDKIDERDNAIISPVILQDSRDDTYAGTVVGLRWGRGLGQIQSVHPSHPEAEK